MTRHYTPGLFDSYDGQDDEVDIERRDPECNRCGSTDVRWRRQGDTWRLFSLTPGVEHRCEINAEGFGPVKE